MGFWNRNDEDPFLKLLLNRYHLNLLSLPRENVHICDVYIKDPNSYNISTPGSAINLLTPTDTSMAPFEIPEITRDEPMGNLVGQVSKDISGKVGLDFIEGFLSKLGGGNIGASLRGAYEGAKNSKLVFGFPNPARDSIDPLLLGSKLTHYSFDVKNALYAENRSYFTVTGIAKTNSINIVVQGDDKQALEIDSQLSEIAKVSGGLTILNNQTGSVTYQGSKSLAFGVELYELEYKDKMKMNLVDKAMVLRGDEPAFIGSPEGDAFITLDS